MTRGTGGVPGLRIAAIAAGGALLAWWLVLAARQVADGGFYSDDFGIQWDMEHLGWRESVENQTRVLGAKPLLAFLLPTTYQLLGTAPAGHHVLAAILALGCAVAFYFVLRALRLDARDAAPIALLALLFPWASATRLWPAGSVNNFAVLLLFAGLMVALRTLRAGGARGLLLHLPASALYAASVLTYDATAVIAAMLWPAYLWLGGWRRGLPRAVMDIAAVGAAALWTKAHTNKEVADLADQLAHVPDVAREGADLIAASLVPASVPVEMPAALTAAALAAALAALVASALRGRAAREGSAVRGAGGGSRREPSWAAVAAVALAALALCWAIYVPQAFYTPTFRGIEDRVNVLALYPAVVLVWAILRAAGSLVARDGYPVAVAGAVAVAIGYGVWDTRNQRDWADAAAQQEPVLAAVERADAPDGSLVLTFGHAAETAPGVPVFNQSWDLHPAAQLRTDSAIHTYPVFEGARLECGAEAFTVRRLPTPLYWTILIAQRGTPRTFPYSRVTFADAADGRSETIRSREQCLEALRRAPETTEGAAGRAPSAR